jgi:signal transduction histidine kinase
MAHWRPMEIDWTRPVGRRGVRPISAEAAVERLRLTVISAGYVALGIVSVFLAVLTVASFPTTVALGLGVVIALAVVPLTQGVAVVHRTLAAVLLGEPVPVSYRDAGPSLLRRPLVWVRDPARWRDVAGLWLSATVGLVLSAVPVALLMVPVASGLKTITIDPTALGFFLTWSGPALVLWWLVTPGLVTTRARADRGVFGDRAAQLAARVSVVEETRAESLDHSAAEIRRIESDLHDGPQARIAAVGMSVGLAEKLVATDPDAAVALLREARETTVSALADLRGVVRGIMPPVLADQGLSAAIEALALGLPLPVTVSVPVPRLPAPIESAAYFAVAEGLANAVKHAEASAASVHGSHDGTRLRLVVHDDGRGGAVADGHGLTGLARRLAAFDGTVSVDSPPGGPTRITLEVPCHT